MTTRTLSKLAAAAALALSGSAFAATVNLSGFTFNPPSPLSVATPSYTGAAGQFSGTLDGNSFVTYCTDLTQTFSFNVDYTGYTVIDGVAAWGAARSLALDQLLSLAASMNSPADAKQSAVVQAAVWEILYETSGTYDFSSGSFVATSSNNGVKSLLNGVDAEVWAMLPGVAVTMHADQLYSREHQDFLVTTPVPEPGTYALMAAGLAAIGFVARRRVPKA